MAKSPDAFRTISEVADWLGVEAHVLRFWETKFIQVKPVKRAGGRRYYRPADMALLGGIRRLLHDDGMTIRGVQKVLREKGMGHVAGLSPDPRSEAATTPQDAHSAPTRRGAPEPAIAEPDADDSPPLPFDVLPVSAPVESSAQAENAAPAATLDGGAQSGAEAASAAHDAPHDARPGYAPARGSLANAPPATVSDSGAPIEAEAAPATPEVSGDAEPGLEPAPERVAQIDPVTAAEILARARALIERLRSTPT